MMNAVMRCGAFAALLVLASACADSVTPTGPTTPTGTTASAPTPPPRSDFPAVFRPARIYLFATALSSPVSKWTSGSRYVLYDDGTFALQSTQASFEGYRGTYTETNALITFRWQHDPRAFAPWGPSTGTLTDDSLTVRYDPIMLIDEFEDAVYIRRDSN